MKVVINKCFGGFGLSEKAHALYTKRIGMVKHDNEILRTDPVLIEIIEQLGEEANGIHAQLKIVEVPDDVQWDVEEYDGIEWIAEQHRTWN